ncbi:AGAP005260-PA-like protein [Anopheles sinensis]|uniref:Thymidylate kinase n=1 Tax=Anopheles sinensis TaxID=74873 RepID=A0A084W9M7_ANOSI|nr:AGAP005260-PA-like protein [Anopheles sinensis]
MSEQQHKRGVFIVFEGCDRAGKTTQCKQLVNKLNDAGHSAQFMNFPDRTTQCGQLINGYLTRKDDFTDEGIHLMFTLNRWEKMKEMEKLLRSGVHLIVDRYSFSGVAFSAAKGLDMEWCKAPEAGLLKPDLVVLLTLSPEAIAKRGGFGDERYEVAEFQKRVMEKYAMLKDDQYWLEVDADKKFEDLTMDLYKITTDTIHNSESKTLGKLW